MDQKKQPKYEFTKVFIVIVSFIILSMISYRLLYLSQIQSSEFVVLIIASMFICLAGYYLKEIQEFSIGGNIVKLRDAKNDLDEAVDRLQRFQLETLRMLLKKSLQFGGGFGSIGFKDERAEYIISLVEEIKKSGYFNQLISEINHVVNILINSHLKQLSEINRAFRIRWFADQTNNYPSPDKLRLSISENMIEEYSESKKKDTNDIEAQIIESINLYVQIYNIKKECENYYES